MIKIHCSYIFNINCDLEERYKRVHGFSSGDTYSDTVFSSVKCRHIVSSENKS